MKTKRVAIIGTALFVAAVIALLGYGFLNVWLPRRVGEAVTEHFGEYVTIGEVRYVFPFGVEIRDVVFVRRPNGILSGEASRLRVKLRPSAVLLFRFDGRLLQEVAADDFTIYLYPLKVPRPRFEPPWKGAPGETGKPLKLPIPRGRFGRTRETREGPPILNEAGKAAKAGTARPEKFDFTFRAHGGRVLLRGEKRDTLIFREVETEGNISDQAFEVSLNAETAERKSFAFEARHSFATRAGTAEYRVEAVEAVHLLPWAGRPGYLLETEGVLTFEGKLTWKGGRVDHRATGRLSHGRLLLAPDYVRISLEEVTLQFTLHNADFTIDEGSCRAAEVRWHFGGRASKLALDVTFRSEDMTLQHLADMIVGEVSLTYAGVGVAELRIFGTPREPQFYLRVERTDK